MPTWRPAINGLSWHGDEGLAQTSIHLDLRAYAWVTETILQFAEAQGASFSLAKLQGANLGSANLAGAVLTGTQLQGANADYADLRAVDFRDDLLPEQTRLVGANLQFADLRGARLHNARL